MELLIETRSYGTKTVLIDDEDWPMLKNYKWHIHLDKGTFYCRCYIRQKNGTFIIKKMHRIVMKLSHKSLPHLDHKDRNGLNNVKSNLRKCDNSKNAQNIGPTSRSTTGYKGVYLYKEGHQFAGLYTAALRARGIKYHGGYFKTAVEAAIKYNELALEHHGEFAYQNKIPKTA